MPQHNCEQNPCPICQGVAFDAEQRRKREEQELLNTHKERYASNFKEEIFWHTYGGL